ncbi:Acyltransferase protein [Neofusicoccum parvum]|uniref:Acyltransferase protein n=1 Tax=Neofusicoccum parvum TaxID=310453 RepID=A0ACB5RQS0_9PEZI|nr:Acyltransferase protein [Neofusicoccum parvum]
MNLQKLLSRLRGPEFPRALFQRRPKNLSNTAWIDGVRGLAALIVTINHLCWNEILHLFQGYGSGGPSRPNTSLLQLPFVSIIFSPRAMVQLFFVISGYCISLSSIRARGGGNSSRPAGTTPTDASAALLSTLSGAVFRRALRLFLPVVAISILSQLLYAAGAFSAWPVTYDSASLPAAGSLSPFAHAGYLLLYWASLVDQVVTGRHCPGSGTADCPVGLNGQLWTIPLELRGSLVLYLVLLGLARVRSAPRLGVLVGLAVVLQLRAWWELATFAAGLLIAELESLRGGREDVKEDDAEGGGEEDGREGEEGEALLPPPPSSPAVHRRRRCGRPDVKCLRNVGVGALALVGWYLLCVPNDADAYGSFGPCYDFLFTHLAPRRWFVVDEIYGAPCCWRAVGAAAFVAALTCRGGLSALLRWPFVSSAAQYFGRISFMLYLVHELVLQTLMPRIQAGLAAVVGEDWGKLTGWSARVVTLVLALWAAEVLVEVLDKRSVALASRLLKRWSAGAPGR